VLQTKSGSKKWFCMSADSSGKIGYGTGDDTNTKTLANCSAAKF
jgi:hypothetical protein